MSFKVDFVIPGAGRSGTTSLYLYLDEHPEIQMSSTKEPRYFADHFGQGEHWYHSLFSGSGDRLAGEASTKYMYDWRSPERMQMYNPEMKCLFVLRNPVDRAYSNYKWEVCRRGEWRSFENAAWGRSSHFLYLGLYGKHLQNYLRYFSRNQLRIFQFERFIERPREVLADACEFLGVSVDYEFKRAGRRTNRPVRPWSLSLQRILKHHLTAKNKDNLLARAAKGIVRKPLDWVNHFSAGNKFEGVSEKTRKKLSSFFRDDLERLDHIVEFDVSKWLPKK